MPAILVLQARITQPNPEVHGYLKTYREPSVKGKFSGLCLFLGLLVMQSCHIHELRLKRSVTFPVNSSYYQVKGLDGEQIQDRHVPWQKSNETVAWDELTLKLYKNHDVLKNSVNLLINNRATEAIPLLESYLKEKTPDRDLAGRINNNLSIAYLLLSPSKTRKAKYHIDQAGILLFSPMEVLQNARVIAYFLQEEIKFHPRLR